MSPRFPITSKQLIEMQDAADKQTVADKLFDAACHGKVEVLINMIKINPSVLAEFTLISPRESLLHVATKCGQLKFVQELLRINHALADEQNNDGFRPLDIAVIMGDLEMVGEILSFNYGLCERRGKDQRTPLHHASVKGRVAVIRELLSKCPNSVKEVTAYGETALHLAVKTYKFDAFKYLVEFLKSQGKEDIINLQDGNGDTVLHLAISTKQHACILLLLDENTTTRPTIELNAINTRGLTALDVLDIQDSYDTMINEKLVSAGAVRYHRIEERMRVRNGETAFQPMQDPGDWFTYFKFQKQRDSPSDARNTLLVVSILIATVCFQAGVDPPDGIFGKPNTSQHVSPSPPPFSQGAPPPPAFNPTLVTGLSSLSAISGSHATDFLFLFANSLGLTASGCIIIYLTSGFPFRRELQIAMYAMMFTYGFAISTTFKDIDSSGKVLAYSLITVAFALPFVLRWVPRWAIGAWEHWRKQNARKTPLPVNK